VYERIAAFEASPGAAVTIRNSNQRWETLH